MYLLHNDLNLEIKTLYFEVKAGWVHEFRLKGKSQEKLIFPTNSPYLHCRLIDSKNGNDFHVSTN